MASIISTMLAGCGVGQREALTASCASRVKAGERTGQPVPRELG